MDKEEKSLFATMDVPPEMGETLAAEEPDAQQAEEAEIPEQEQPVDNANLDESDSQNDEADDAPKAEEQIPAWDQQLLDRARNAGLTESAAKGFGDPVALENFLIRTDQGATAQPVGEREGEPAEPEPQKPPEFAFDLQPFALSQEQRENFDPDIVQVLDSMNAHYQQNLSGLVEAIKTNVNPVIQEVGKVREYVAGEMDRRAESEFDSTLDALVAEEFTGAFGASRAEAEKDRQQFNNRGVLYRALPAHIGTMNQIRRGTGDPRQVTRREAMEDLLGTFGHLRTPAPKTSPKKDAALQGRQAQMLGRPQASPPGGGKSQKQDVFKRTVPFALPDGVTLE